MTKARSLRTIIGDLVELSDRGSRWRLSAVLALTSFNTVLEAVAAFGVVGFVQLVSRPAAAIPTPFRQVIGTDPGWSQRRLLITAAVLLCAFYVVKNLLVAVQSALQAREANRIAAVTADRLFTAYLTSRAEDMTARNSADMVRNITTSTDSMLRQSVFSLVNMVSDTLILLAVLVVVLVKQPLLTPIVGSALSALLVSTYLILRRRLDRLGVEANRQFGRNIGHIQEGIGAFREIRVLGRESYFLRQQRLSRDRLADTRWKFDTVYQLPRLMFETVFVLSLAVIATVVALRSGPATDVVPVLALFAYAGFRLLPSVNRITMSLSTLRYGADAIATVRDELAATQQDAASGTAHVEVTGPAEPGARPGAGERATFERLDLVNVSYCYPERDLPAVSDINLTVERGIRLGIVGVTGAGKSTLLDLLIGLIRPSNGLVLLDGADVWQEPRRWQDMLGYVPQSPFLVDGTVRRNVALGLPDGDIDEARVSEALRLAQIDDFVAALEHGLDTVVGERGVRMSGGQRQRIAIARALYHDPEILVFDEATSSLDYETERALTAAIAELATRKTLVIVAHRLSTVRDCERIVLLEAGHVAATGTFPELVAGSPQFAALLQAGSLVDDTRMFEPGH